MSQDGQYSGQDPHAAGGQQYPYGAPPSYGQPGYSDPNWQGAYGQPYGVEQQAYGQQGYGYPGQGGPYAGAPYGQYGPYAPPRNDGTRTHAIVALVVSIVLALSCYLSLGGLAGAIMSGIALSKVDSEPQTARNLLKWCWIAIGINVGLLVGGIGFAIIVASAS